MVRRCVACSKYQVTTKGLAVVSRQCGVNGRSVDTPAVAPVWCPLEQKKKPQGKGVNGKPRKGLFKQGLEVIEL